MYAPISLYIWKFQHILKMLACPAAAASVWRSEWPASKFVSAHIPSLHLTAPRHLQLQLKDSGRGQLPPGKLYRFETSLKLPPKIKNTRKKEVEASSYLPLYIRF